MTHRSAPPISTSPSNWLITAKQMWKLYVALLGFTGTFLCFVVAGVALMMEGQLWSSVVLGGVILGTLTFIWMSQSLCCPACERPLVWTMIRKHSHMSWLVDLVNLTECPLCKSNLNKIPSGNPRRVKRSS